MAITIQHSNIETPLQLAQLAGQGEGFQRAQQAQFQAEQLANQAQQIIDNRRATEIQAALQQDAMRIDAERAAAQMAQQNAQRRAEQEFRQRQLDVEQQYRTMQGANQQADNERLLAQQQAEMQGMAQQDAAARQLIQTLPPSEQQAALLEYQATGRIPANLRAQAPSRGQDGYDNARLRLMRDAATAANREVDRLSGQLEGLMVADPIMGTFAPAAGQEQQVAQLEQRLRAAQAQADAANQQYQQGLQVAIDPETVERLVSGQQQPMQRDADGVPVVSSAAEHAALPSGATYVWAGDGQTYVKN